MKPDTEITKNHQKWKSKTKVDYGPKTTQLSEYSVHPLGESSDTVATEDGKPHAISLTMPARV